MQNITQQSEHSKSYSLNLCQSKKYISPQTCTLYQPTNLHRLLYQPTNLYTVNSFIDPRWSNGSIAVHSVHNKFKIYIHTKKRRAGLVLSCLVFHLIQYEEPAEKCVYAMFSHFRTKISYQNIESAVHNSIAVW